MGAWLGWTDQNKAEAKRLFIEEARSYTEICKALNAPSRSAVCGKLHRMGVVRSDSAVSASRIVHVRRQVAAAQHVRPAAPPKPRPEPAPAPTRVTPPPPAPPTGGKSLVELRATDCRYPTAGAGADTRYCGGFAVDPTHPWCREHEAVVFKPSKP